VLPQDGYKKQTETCWSSLLCMWLIEICCAGVWKCV